MADLENLTEEGVLWENGILSRQYVDGRREELLDYSDRTIPENALRNYLSVNPSQIRYYELHKSKSPKLAFIILNVLNYGGESVRKLRYGQRKEIVEEIYNNFKDVEGEEARKVREYCGRCLSSMEKRTKYRHPESIAIGTMERVNKSIADREIERIMSYEDEDVLYEMAEGE